MLTNVGSAPAAATTTAAVEEKPAEEEKKEKTEEDEIIGGFGFGDSSSSEEESSTIIGADAALPAALTAPAVLGNCLFFDPRVQCVHWSALLLSKLPQKIGLEHNSTSLASETACLLFRCKSRNKCGFRQRLRVKPLHLSVPLAKVFRVH